MPDSADRYRIHMRRRMSMKHAGRCGRRLVTVVVLTALFGAGQSALERARAATMSAADDVVIEMPLDDGRIDIAALLRQALTRAGLDPTSRLRDLDWSVDVSSLLGRAQLQAINRLTDDTVSIDIDDDVARLTLDRGRLQRPATTARRWMQDVIDVADEDSSRAFGMFMISDDGERTPVNADSLLPEDVVLLVHGLDDPGWLWWKDVIAALQEAQHHIVLFECPNDAPIADAADLLAVSLMDMRRADVLRVHIVAHSMGGLVCRDVLTRLAYYNSSGAGDDRLPAVDRLIMLATPNHGSHLVRLRAVSEIQEQIARAVQGHGHWTNWLADGAGEAATDLMPGSTYLTRLNRRELPTHTKVTIVAGRWSPLDDDEVRTLSSSIERIAGSDAAPQWLRDWMSRVEHMPIEDLLRGAVDGLGDGVVSLESALLEGVDDVKIIEANHLSTIVSTDQRTAPAIPIVLERLAETGTVDDPAEAPN